MREGFAEMREGLAEMREGFNGMAQITALLTKIAAPEGLDQD
jgi:hypothetical protein